MEFWIDIARIEEISQLPRPMPLRFDMAGQEVFMWGRSQRERMVFRRFESSTVQTYPLTGQVLKVRWAVELHFEYVGW